MKNLNDTIRNILEEELFDEVVVAKFETTTKHGTMKINNEMNKIQFYNVSKIKNNENLSRR